MDLFPLWLSLKVSVTATILTVATGLPLAWVLARKRFPGRDLAEAVVVLPLVLPPTVLGYYLLVLISRQGVIGRTLDAAGIELAFTWRAAVLAACGRFVPPVHQGRAGRLRVRRPAARAGGADARTFRVEHLLVGLTAARLTRHNGRHRARILPRVRRLRHHADGRRQHPRPARRPCRSPSLITSRPTSSAEANVLSLIAVAIVASPPDGARACRAAQVLMLALTIQVRKALPGFMLDAAWEAGDEVVALFGPSVRARH